MPESSGLLCTPTDASRMLYALLAKLSGIQLQCRWSPVLVITSVLHHCMMFVHSKFHEVNEASFDKETFSSGKSGTMADSAPVVPLSPSSGFCKTKLETVFQSISRALT